MKKEFSLQKELKNGFAMPAPLPEKVIKWFSENTLIKSVMGESISPYVPITQTNLYNTSVAEPGESKTLTYNVLVKNLAIRSEIDEDMWSVWDKIIISISKTIDAERVTPGTGSMVPMKIVESFDITIQSVDDKPRCTTTLEGLFDELL